MKFNLLQGLVDRTTHLLATVLVGTVALVLLTSPVHADALLGVIGYHIVPMQLENEEGQQEEGSDEGTSDSDQTTVAQNTINYRQLTNKYISVSHASYIPRHDQLLGM